MKVRYLRPAKQMPEIYLYRAPVDFRKQANGLALLVEQELGHNPFSGALYAFTNRQRNKIKCVMWEDNGFVMLSMAITFDPLSAIKIDPPTIMFYSLFALIDSFHLQA